MAECKKRILLFWPNTSNRGRITLSIPILSAISKDMGWETKYFDTSFYDKADDSFTDREKTGTFKPTQEENSLKTQPDSQIVVDLQNIIDSFQPDVIAITSMTNDFQYMMTFFPQLNIPKNTTVIFGGTHSLHQSSEILNTNIINLLCFGQGEYVLPKILKRIEKGENLYGIPGTSYKHIYTNEILTHPVSQALLPNFLWGIDPDYSFYDERYYSYPFDGKIVNMFWLEVGRGCPFNCTYCEAPQIRNLYKGKGKYVLTRPLDSIFRTIKKVQERYKIDVFNITHECFFIQPKKWLKEFCQRWKKEVKKSFLIQTRMETVNEENLDLLKTSGAPIIQIGQGIESGSPRILQKICNRRINIDGVVKSYKLMRQKGFRTNAFYMLGFPTETRDDIFATIGLCKRVNADVDSVSIFQPYPGLPLSKMCIKNGWITGNETIPSFTSKSIINQPSISPQEVTNLQRVFLLYAKLPNTYWKSIKTCEDNPQNTKLFNELINLRWKLHGNR